MYSLTDLTSTSLNQNSSTNRPPLGRVFVLIALASMYVALSPQARAACQQGCGVGNGNTFLGDNAGTTGVGNTAIGSGTLFSNTNGNANTASGAFALASNTTGSANTASGTRAAASRQRIELGSQEIWRRNKKGLQRSTAEIAEA